MVTILNEHRARPTTKVANTAVSSAPWSQYGDSKAGEDFILVTDLIIKAIEQLLLVSLYSIHYFSPYTSSQRSIFSNRGTQRDLPIAFPVLLPVAYAISLQIQSGYFYF